MTPPSLKSLCAAATPGPWVRGENRPMYLFSLEHLRTKRSALAEVLVQDWDSAVPQIPRETADANAQLIARLSPDVALKVYEALEFIEATCDLKSDIHERSKQALRLLDGLTPRKEQTP